MFVEHAIQHIFERVLIHLVKTEEGVENMDNSSFRMLEKTDKLFATYSMYSTMCSNKDIK